MLTQFLAIVLCCNFLNLLASEAQSLSGVAEGVSVQNTQKNSELSAAIQNGDLEAAGRCLEDGARIDAVFCLTEEVEDDEGKVTQVKIQNVPSLHLAALASQNCRGIVNYLVESGANVNGVDGLGQSALHYALSRWVGAVPAEEEDSALEAVKALLDVKGINVELQDNAGRTPMHIAAQVGCVEAITLLLEAGAAIDPTDSKGMTPLHVAAIRERVESVQALVENGAAIEAMTKEGRTAFSLAASGRLYAASALLRRGANPHVTDGQGGMAANSAKPMGITWDKPINTGTHVVVKGSSAGEKLVLLAAGGAIGALVYWLVQNQAKEAASGN